MKILLNKEIELNKWHSLLHISNQSSPFQTPEFNDFFNSINGFSSDVFAIEENNEYKTIVVVTVQQEKGIKGYFSRRGIIFGGPLVVHEEKKYLQHLLKYINEYYYKKLIYLETRNYFDYSSLSNQFTQSGFRYVPWLNFHLETSEVNSMKKSMSSSRLRQIKKGIKNGAQWKEAQSINDINIFYNILSNLYKNKIKKPLLPKSFFLEFYKHKIGKYLLVYFEDKIIGGIMCPIKSEKAIYEFYVCGLDNEFKDQYPSVIATWAAMEYANQNNIPKFDFMGAGSPDDTYGVRDFKARFGGELVEHGRYINILNPLLYKTGVLGLKLLSKLK